MIKQLLKKYTRYLLFIIELYLSYCTHLTDNRRGGALFIAVLQLFGLFRCFSVCCSIVKQMLMQFFGDFVNFTGANSHFCRPCRKRKHPQKSRNSRFQSEHAGLILQIKGRSQSETCRWRNTIFGFLNAQLDFLAIFSTPP